MSSRYFNYFTHPELPSPTIGNEEVRAHLAEHFGITVAVESLGSQQDQNFILLEEGSTRRPLGVLKLSNPVFSDEEIEMQDVAAATVALSNPDIRIPVVVDGPRGPMAGSWSTSQGVLNARVLSHVSGRTLTGSGYLSPAVVARMGELAGAASLALRDVSHPASARVLQWDLRHAARVVETLLPGESDIRVHDVVRAATAEASAEIEPLQGRLPLQLGHFDITDDNIIAPTGSPLPDAIIDFGDVSSSWAVGEIAVTVSSVLHHDDAHPLSTLPAIRAFHAMRPLNSDEVDALWPLVVLRAAVLVLSGRQQVAVDADNSYARAALDRELRILEVATSVPLRVVTAALRNALGFPTTSPTWEAAALLSLVNPVRLDAGTIAETNDAGAWLDESTLDTEVNSMLAAGASAAYLPAWRPRLTGAPRRTTRAPANVPTAALLWLGEPQTLAVPDGASVKIHDQDGISISLAGAKVTLQVAASRGPPSPRSRPFGYSCCIRARTQRVRRACPPNMRPAGAWSSATRTRHWASLRRRTRTRLSSSDVKACWHRCRSTTTRGRRRLSAAGASTSSTRMGACTWTW